MYTEFLRQGAALMLSALLVLPGILAPEEAPERAKDLFTDMAEAAIQYAPKPDESWKTLLVNAWNPLPEEFAVELTPMDQKKQVDARIKEDLDAMLDACRAAGLDSLVCSAYRTESTQTRLYNNKVNRLRAAGYGLEAAREEAARWVAVPGTSEHQTGLALDIVARSYQVLDKKQENTPEQKWLMEHSWEYGFILRYPSDKSELTGVGYEPWHYRYVGKEAAADIYEQGICLEEYLALEPTVEGPAV